MQCPACTRGYHHYCRGCDCDLKWHPEERMRLERESERKKSAEADAQRRFVSYALLGASLRGAFDGCEEYEPSEDNAAVCAHCGLTVDKHSPGSLILREMREAWAYDD